MKILEKLRIKLAKLIMPRRELLGQESNNEFVKKILSMPGGAKFIFVVMMSAEPLFFEDGKDIAEFSEVWH